MRLESVLLELTVCFGYVPAQAVELMLKVTPGLGVQESDIHPGPQAAETDAMVGEKARRRAAEAMITTLIVFILKYSPHDLTAS